MGNIEDNLIPELAVFKKISIPIIARVYPQLISGKITSIQPLNTPSYFNYLDQMRVKPIELNSMEKTSRQKHRSITDKWEVSKECL